MIDANREKLRSFAQISKEHAVHPSVATLHRWRLKGVKGHRLETVAYGGRRYTTLEAVDRFAALLSGPGSAGGPQVSLRRQDDMARAADEAEAIF